MTLVSKPIGPLAASAPAVPTATPTEQPSSDSISASSRNCRRIAARGAPIAMRMPISRVRSVTETSMMFMMPMPPTIRLIEPIAASSAEIAAVVVDNVSVIAVRLVTVKSSALTASSL